MKGWGNWKCDQRSNTEMGVGQLRSCEGVLIWVCFTVGRIAYIWRVVDSWQYLSFLNNKVLLTVRHYFSRENVIYFIFKNDKTKCLRAKVVSKWFTKVDIPRYIFLSPQTHWIWISLKIGGPLWVQDCKEKISCWRKPLEQLTQVYLHETDVKQG